METHGLCLLLLLMPVSRVSYNNFLGRYMNQWDCALEKEVVYKKDRAS